LKRNFEHIILRVNLDKFTSESTAESNQEHRKLLASLKKGDIPKGMRLVQKHIQKTKGLIIQSLSREELEELETMEFFEDGRRAF
jgi:DNA-binding GntR family transcriptional regulator